VQGRVGVPVRGLNGGNAGRPESKEGDEDYGTVGERRSVSRRRDDSDPSPRLPQQRGIGTEIKSVVERMERNAAKET